MSRQILQAREEWLPLVRVDSAMRKVPEETFVQIVEWHHRHGVPQYKLAALAEKEGLEGADALPGKTAMSEFFESFLPVYSSVLRRRAAATAEEILKEADAANVPWLKATRETLGPQVFRMMQDPEADPKLLLAMVGQLRNLYGDAKDAEELRLKLRALELKEKTDTARIEMAERKLQMLEAKAAKAGEALSDGSLSDAEKAQRMRQIFGIVG